MHRDDNMVDLLRIIKYYKAPLLIGFSQWLITMFLQVDRAFFDYDYPTEYYWIVKACYLIALLVIWSFIFFVYKKIKNGDKFYSRLWQVMRVYLFVEMLLLLILWPGTWSWDDLLTLKVISWYSDFDAWQHVLTGIYQAVLLQILPFPGGIIILQSIIIALCVGYFMARIETSYEIVRLKNKYLDILLKIIPFLLPPVLMYQFSGYRMGLYIYLELVTLIMIICGIKDKQEWKWNKIWILSFLVIVISVWRTESFVYIPCIGILICAQDKKVLSKTKKLLFILTVILGFAGLTNYQNYELGNSNYQIISLMRPEAEIVRIADDVEDAKELKALDKVTDLQVIYDNPDLNGEELFWNTGCVRNRNEDPYDDFSQNNYKKYLRALIKLSLKYPKVVLEERWNLFLIGSGVTGETFENVDRSADLFEPDNGNVAIDMALASGWRAITPLFRNLRREFIILLGGHGVEIYRKIVWNAIIPILVLIYAWVKSLVGKKWSLWMLISAVVVRVPIVFITEPSGWIMYLLSFYFLGYVYLVYILWINYSKKKGAIKYE